MWGITRHADVLGDREGPEDLLQQVEPAPARPGAPDDDLDGRPDAHTAPAPRVPRLHAEAGARQGADDPPHLHADHRQRVRARRVRLRLGHRRTAAVAADRRHARLPRGVVRRPPALVGRPHPGHDRHAHRGDDAEVRRRRDGLPRVPTRRDRRSTGEAPTRRSREHPVPCRDRRREARRRVARAGDAADPHRRRRDHPSRDQHRHARAHRQPRSARHPRRRATTTGASSPSRSCCGGSRRSRTCRAP